MGVNSNAKKAKALGMPHGTASARLKKEVMFQLVKSTHADICFRCGERIKSAEELSIDHKVDWLNSDDPMGLFFNLANISFSHLKCNSAASKPKKGPQSKHGTTNRYDKWGCRCKLCREAKSIKNKKRKR